MSIDIFIGWNDNNNISKHTNITNTHSLWCHSYRTLLLLAIDQNFYCEILAVTAGTHLLNSTDLQVSWDLHSPFCNWHDYKCMQAQWPKYCNHWALPVPTHLSRTNTAHQYRGGSLWDNSHLPAQNHLPSRQTCQPWDSESVVATSLAIF